MICSGNLRPLMFCKNLLSDICAFGYDIVGDTLNIDSDKFSGNHAIILYNTHLGVLFGNHIITCYNNSAAAVPITTI